jgi:hypothetical protein
LVIVEDALRDPHRYAGVSTLDEITVHALAPARLAYDGVTPGETHDVPNVERHALIIAEVGG